LDTAANTGYTLRVGYAAAPGFQPLGTPRGFNPDGVRARLALHPTSYNLPLSAIPSIFSIIGEKMILLILVIFFSGCTKVNTIQLQSTSTALPTKSDSISPLPLVDTRTEKVSTEFIPEEETLIEERSFINCTFQIFQKNFGPLEDNPENYSIYNKLCLKVEDKQKILINYSEKVLISFPQESINSELIPIIVKTPHYEMGLYYTPYYIQVFSKETNDFIFKYFTMLDCGDRPFLELLSSSFMNNSLFLKYNFINILGQPYWGLGEINLEYSYIRNSFALKNYKEDLLGTDWSKYDETKSPSDVGKIPISLGKQKVEELFRKNGIKNFSF
jgi:hypothetical protein